jgi:hypothetical protein
MKKEKNLLFFYNVDQHSHVVDVPEKVVIEKAV